MAEGANRTIRRVFEVLDYLDGRNRPVRLKDVTADLGYPVSSASDVLKSLVVLGYLNFDRDTMSYTLTARVTTLGTRLNDALWQDRPLMAALERLHALTESIRTVRRRGYAFSRHTWHPGIGIIAMPVPHPVGGRWCALGAAGSVDELDRAERAIAAELRAAVRDLSPSRKS